MATTVSRQLKFFLGLAVVCGMSQFVHAEVDRDHKMGEDSFENGQVGNAVGFPCFFGTDVCTADSMGTPLAGDLQDLRVRGNLIYANVSDRPNYTTGVGIEFDGDGDFLYGPNLNLPATSAASQGYDDVQGAEPGPLNYDGIVDRGFQFWVKPDLASQTALQTVVTDADQHGVQIVDGKWSMRYGGDDYNSQVAVAFDQWSHIQLVRPDGANNGSALYLDGIMIAALDGEYDGAVNLELVVGSNTSRDNNDPPMFDGGTENFFHGLMDNLTMSVYGDNTSQGGQNWGFYNFAEDNEVAAAALDGVLEADINLDGFVRGDGTGPAATDDVTAFVDGWLSENRINDVVMPDLNSRMRGDLDLNGITDLADYGILNLANPSLAASVADHLFGVPEPSSLTMCALAAALLAGLRRRR